MIKVVERTSITGDFGILFVVKEVSGMAFSNG